MRTQGFVVCAIALVSGWLVGPALGQTQSFVLDCRSLVVPSSGTATFTVALANDPGALITATVALASFSVTRAFTIQSGTSLSFDSANYAIPQTVTLAGTGNPGAVNPKATLEVRSPGIPTAEVETVVYGSGCTTPTLIPIWPLAGEIQAAGTTKRIRWAAVNPIGTVEISLRKGGRWVANLGSAPTAAEQWDWSISPTLADGDDYQTVVGWYECGAPVEAISDPFAISRSATLHLTRPVGGEAWTAGATERITWEAANPSGYVNILLFKGGFYYAHIAAVPMSDRQFDWTIGTSIGDGNDYAIVLDRQDSAPRLRAAGNAFTISGSSPAPTLTVTGPAGGAKWTAGSMQRITWQSANPTGDVDIILNKNGDGYAYLGRVPMSDGQFDWTIPATIGNSGTTPDYTIEVGLLDGRVLVKGLSGTFAITGSSAKPTLVLKRPTAGEVWSPGTCWNITWQGTVPSGYVDVELFRNGQWYAPLGSAAAMDGTFTWSIPANLPPANDYAVRIGWYEAGLGVGVTSSSMSICASGDFNNDGDIDSDDMASITSCLTGPTIPYGPAGTPNGCWLIRDDQGFIAVDFDRDGDFDLDDFAVLQLCYNGSNMPVDPNCAKLITAP